MNLRRFVLLWVAVTTTTLTGFSQKADLTQYPNVTSDLAEGQNLIYFLKHRITLPGVWGLGINAQYTINHLAYASVDGGYGWVIGKHVPDFDKKFRGWIDVKVGYPILSFTSKTNGKWVVSQSSTHDYYYTIDVPVHASLIALVGFTSEPTSIKIYPDGTGNGGGPVQPYSFQAPVYTVGLKWRSYLKANVKANSNTGMVSKLFEFYAGLVIPSKSEINTPVNYRNLPKTNKMGYDLHLTLPYRLNGFATFDIGIKSLGYNDNARFYLGNTFYL